MQQRALGQQGLVVSALGLGTMGMTMAYGTRYAEASLPAWV
jgi:aryl-alcohol dehydrogenase-like predicted oxidoreductase